MGPIAGSAHISNSKQKVTLIETTTGEAPYNRFFHLSGRYELNGGWFKAHYYDGETEETDFSLTLVDKDGSQPLLSGKLKFGGSVEDRKIVTGFPGWATTSVSAKTALDFPFVEVTPTSFHRAVTTKSSPWYNKPVELQKFLAGVTPKLVLKTTVDGRYSVFRINALKIQRDSPRNGRIAARSGRIVTVKEAQEDPIKISACHDYTVIPYTRYQPLMGEEILIHSSLRSGGRHPFVWNFQGIEVVEDEYRIPYEPQPDRPFSIRVGPRGHNNPLEEYPIDLKKTLILGQTDGEANFLIPTRGHGKSIVAADSTISLRAQDCFNRDVTWSMTAKEKGSDESSFDLELKKDGQNSYSDEITTGFEEQVEVAFRAADPEEARAPDGRDTNPLQLIIHAESGSGNNTSQDAVTITQTDVATLRQEYEDVGYVTQTEINEITEDYGWNPDNWEAPNMPRRGIFRSGQLEIPHSEDDAGHRGEQIFGSDNYDFFIADPDLILGLRQAGNRILDNFNGQTVLVNGAQTTIDVKDPNHELFPIISNYRAPAVNKTEAGVRPWEPNDAGGVANSRHLYGRALDMDFNGDNGQWEHNWAELADILGDPSASNCEALRLYLLQEANAESASCRDDSIHTSWSD